MKPSGASFCNMNIDNLISEIFKKNGSISKVDTLILIETILDKYFDKNKIKYKQRNTGSYGFDLILETDFKNHKAPCGIEIFADLEKILANDYKNIRKKIDQEFELKKTQSLIFNLINKDQFNSIIFITLLDDNDALSLEKKILSSYPNSELNLKVYSKNFLNDILTDLTDDINDIVDKLFSVKLQNLVFSKNENWKIKRDNLLKELKSQYKNSGKTSLLLGAGVSCSANLPSWDELISSLFITYLIKSSSDNPEISNMPVGEYIEVIKHISKTFSEKYLSSALLSARYLRTGFFTQNQDSQSFIKELQKTLYDREMNKSELINIIGKLCVPTRTGAKVKSVITYNFDNLFEQHLDSINLKYRSIFLDNDNYSNEELPIYHVHGFIPQNIELSNDNSFEKMDLIFSEEGYHRMYSNPYHWSNLIQLSTLKENTCIMIGLSMDDPNLRRLLEIAQTGNENIQHFAFLKRINISEISKKIKNSTKLESAFLERHHNLQELMFSELGVNIIWFEKFEELPKLLNQISS